MQIGWAHEISASVQETMYDGWAHEISASVQETMYDGWAHEISASAGEGPCIMDGPIGCLAGA